MKIVKFGKFGCHEDSDGDLVFDVEGFTFDFESVNKHDNEAVNLAAIKAVCEYMLHMSILTFQPAAGSA